MSRRFDYAMKKGKGRRKKDTLGDFSIKTKGVFPSDNTDGIRVRGDGAASPEADGMKSREWSGTGLPLTVHSVPVGNRDKSRADELGGITDRISKLLNDYESLYDDEESSRQAIQQSVTGQIHIETLLTDYNVLCQEREGLLESLQDSLDLDEEEVLDELERRAKESAAAIEGSETIVQETFNNAKGTFEKLKGLNKDMLNMSKQGQDTTKLEQEKQELENELNMYKKMSVQQRMDNAYNQKRRRSIIRKDETQQWKLVAGEMLDIVKGIKMEGKLDKVKLEKDLNNILMTMNNQNDTIEKLKVELSTSETKCQNLEQEKVKLYRDMTTVREDLETKCLENNQFKRTIKQLKTEKRQNRGAAPQVPDEVDVTPEVRIPTPITQENTAPVDLLQAQLRDQKNKAMKFESQNKDLQQQIEAFNKEARKRREKELSIAQMVMKESGDNACSNCQILGSQVISSKDEMDQLNAKINKLENDLVSVRDQLNNALKEVEEANKSRTTKGGRKKPEVTISVPSKDSVPRALPPSPSEEPAAETDVQEAQAESPDEPDTPLKPTTKKKSKKPEPRKTSSKPKKKAAKAKQPEESTKEEPQKEQKTQKKEDIVEKKKEEPAPSESRKLKDAEFSSDEKAPYVKVREAKLMTLCDKGTQTGYLGRMATMNTVHRRDSIGSWKAGKGERKHSLTEAIMSIAPPAVVEQETSMVMTNIFEEVDRLCEEIGGFVEYGYELVQNEASTLQAQAEKHFGVDNAKEIVKEGDQDVLPSIDRRLSLHGGGGGAGSRRRSSVLQLDTRRGSIRNRDSIFPTELLERKRADTLTEVEDETNKHVENRPEEQEGMPVITISPTESLKENIASMAQKAIDIIKGTGEVLTVQLNHKLLSYEKFYDMWKVNRQRRQSLKGSVMGKGILPSVSFEKAERSSKSMGGIEDDADKMEIEPGMLFPHISSSAHHQVNKGKPISMAKLSSQGMMMIGSNTIKPAEQQQVAAQSAPAKKRVKPMSRQQQMVKQKALLEKVLHVDSRMEDIRSIVMGTNQSPRASISQASQGYQQTVYTNQNQSFNLPFITHGITSQERQVPDKKAESAAIQRRMSVIEEVDHSSSTTWNAKQPIPKYHSTNEVPQGKSDMSTVTKRKAKRKLPSLTISNFLA